MSATKRKSTHVHDRMNLVSYAYLDPGNGYVFSTFASQYIGIALTSLVAFFLAVKLRLFRCMSRHKYITFVGLLISISFSILAIVYYTHSMKLLPNTRVVVLAIDGMDPDILEDGWKRGLFPHLRALKQEGSYTKLSTTTPPQSPVAWGTFLTGRSPAGHGIYDFIARDPATYALSLTFSDPKKNPLTAPPVWKTLGDNNITTTTLYLPDTYPAPPIKGSLLSGMGVPDVTGLSGAFTLITSSNAYTLDKKWRGKLVSIGNSNRQTLALPGPKYTDIQGQKTSTIPLTIEKKENGAVLLTVHSQSLLLMKGTYSPYISLQFPIGMFRSVHAVVKFLLVSQEPDLTIYCTPFYIDPANPIEPISTPPSFAATLARRYGMFATLGIPHDTWALEEHIVSDAAFLTEADTIFDERQRIIQGELARFKSGLFIGYFGILDTISHMYWRFLGDSASPYAHTIESYYSKVDTMVGDIVKILQPTDTLLILSDHGFTSFTKEFNLNAWLRDHGYLALLGGKTIGEDYLETIDWEGTRAYAVGYNSLYFNMRGREKQGVLTEDVRISFEKNLIQELLSIKDPDTDEPVFLHVYTRNELGITPTDKTAPDLILGYNRGIRASWDTVVGGAPIDVFTKRTSLWAGDHLFDATVVPGILFSSKKFQNTRPSIVDIAPSILSFFHITKPSAMEGTSLW